MVQIYVPVRRQEHIFALNPSSGSKKSAVIKDIISGKLSNALAIEERVKIASLPFHGPFYLYQITWDDPDRTSPRLLCRELKRQLGHDNIIYWPQEIIVIEKCTDVNENPGTDAAAKIISEFAASHGCKAALSEPFDTLADLKSAYDQTCYTFSFLKRIINEDSAAYFAPVSKKRFLERPLFTYREIFVRSIFNDYSRANSDAVDNVVYVRLIHKLIAYDAENNKNLVKILYYYLCNERNASKAGELLNMTRNNVVYHVAKINDILQLDLDEHRHRFGLIIAYNLLGIYF